LFLSVTPHNKESEARRLLLDGIDKPRILIGVTSVEDEQSLWNPGRHGGMTDF
jgi:hypothetical protein